MERLAALKPVPPLLVIFGTEDAIVPPEHAKYFEQVPGAKIVVIPGAGHSPMVEKPEKVVELVRAFEAKKIVGLCLAVPSRSLPCN